jgi:GT2 family glycosyltransferase
MPTLLIVVVRYQVPLEQAPVMRSLNTCFAETPELLASVATLVWDNSPEPAVDPTAGFPFTYRHSERNLGVSGAYNRAADLAEQAGCGWLLLLDQDTTLPAGFVTAMLAYAQRFAEQREPAAVAPTIVVGEATVSPKVARRWAGAGEVPAGYQGLCRQEVMLVNSGLLLRVAALRAIGGFSPEFWLDFSDRYLCHMLAQHGMPVWLAGELRLQHHISLMAGEGGISEERYANLVAAEDAYFALYRSSARNAAYRLRLLRSAWGERRAHPERARLLWRHFLRRLYLSQKIRLRAWRAEVAARGIALDPPR